jgi:hypothetical protein
LKGEGNLIFGEEHVDQGQPDSVEQEPRPFPSVLVHLVCCYNKIHKARHFIKKRDLFSSQFWRFKNMTLTWSMWDSGKRGQHTLLSTQPAFMVTNPVPRALLQSSFF